MFTEVKHLIFLVGLGFVLILFGLGIIQFAKADELAVNPRNPRLALPVPSALRGGILARGGEVITTGPGPIGRDYRVPSLCHTVGYATTSYGASGLEAAFDKTLAGRDPRSTLATWFAEFRGEKGRGGDLLTTIDLGLQRAAAEALGRRRGAVVVLDAATGDILALVSEPRFVLPPTRISWERDRQRADGPLLHRGLQGLYPPGSTFKIIAAEAALRRGQADFSLDCSGRTNVGGRRFKDAQAGGHGKTDLARALAVSCNVYFTNLGAAMERQALSGAAEAFGLGAPAPLELETAAGQVPMPRDRVEQGATAIGQGRVLVTPLQMAMVAAAVANNGLIMRPRLVQAVRYASGTEQFAPQPWKRATTPEIAESLRRYLIAAVERGTGRRARVPGMIIGGKTGTAQAPGGRDHAWFVGFGLSRGRPLAVAVVVERGGGGGAVAAPVAAAVWRTAGGER